MTNLSSLPAKAGEPGTDAGEAELSALLSADLTTERQNYRDEGDKPPLGTDAPAGEAAPATTEVTEEERTDATDQPDGEGAGDDKRPEGEDHGFELTEGDRDFTEEAYTKAAQHFAARGNNVNLNDPTTRAFLKNFMETQGFIKKLTGENEQLKGGAKSAEDDSDVEVVQPEAEAPKDAAKPAVEAQPPAEAVYVPPTLEQVEKLEATAGEYARKSVNADWARKKAARLLDLQAKMIWPGKFKDAKYSDTVMKDETATAAALEYIQELSTMAIMQVSDALPGIMQMVPQAMGAYDPTYTRMQREVDMADAYDALAGEQGTDGTPKYPQLDELIDSGAIAAALKRPEIANAKYRDKATGKPVSRVRAAQARIRAAYRFAASQAAAGVSPAALEEAANGGARAEAERQEKVRSGALPSGTSRGTTQPESSVDKMLKGWQGSQGKFSRALADSRKK